MRKKRTKEPDCFEIVMWERDKNGNPVRQVSQSANNGYKVWKFHNQYAGRKKKKTKAATAEQAKEILDEINRNFDRTDSDNSGTGSNGK